MWSSIEDWCLSLRAAGRPPSTVSLRRHQLRRLAEDHPRGPRRVTERDLTAWLGGHDWARETLRSHRAAVRLYFAWAMRTGVVAANPAADLPPVPARPPAPRPAPEWAVEEARRSPDDRVELMVCLAAHAGLRRAEIAHCRGDWLVEDLGGWSLRVLGKGDRVRMVPIEDWLAAMIRRACPAGGWVFPGGVDGHLSPWWVGRLVSRALPDAWSTHALRHRYATRVYRGSRDLLATQALLGHSKPETTRLYVLIEDESLRAASRFAA